VGARVRLLRLPWPSRASLSALGVSLAVAAGCASTRPAPPVSGYLQALESGDVTGAWKLTSERYRRGTSEEQFSTRFADPRARAAHVAAIRSALGTVAPELLEQAPAAPAPSEAVRGLVSAARAGRFEEAWRWLSAPERARYTPERLASDLRAVPDAEQRLTRALEAVERPGQSSGTETRWPLPTGGAVRVVLEDGQPRVAALE
jgi:hypothetical protein